MTTTGASNFFCWINVFKNIFFSVSTPENVYLDTKKFRWIRSWDIYTYSDLVGHFVKWPPLESVKCLLFCWINVFINTLFFISTPRNVYLDKSYFDCRWIRSWDIDTRRMRTLSAIFKMATTGVSICFCSLKNILFCYKWPSKYTCRHRHLEYLWIRSWHKN